MKNAILLVVSVFGLCSSVGADPPGSNSPSSYFGESTRLDARGVNRQLTRTVALRVTENRTEDIVVLREGTPTVSVDPSLFDAHLSVPVYANDIDAFQAAPGIRPELLTVGPDGLRGWVWDSDTQSFDNRQLGDSSWIDARLVRSADIDGNGNSDIVGVGADARSILMLYDAGNPGIASQSSINNVPYDIDGLTLVDQLADGVLEIAVKGPLALTVYNQGGGAEDFFFAAGGDGALITLDRGSGLPESLAWFSALGADDYVAVIDSTGMTHALNLGPMSVVGASAGDIDGDGAEDVVVSHGASSDLLILLRQPDGGFNLDSEASGSLSYGTLVPHLENRAWPLLFDLDRDFDPDLICPVQSSQEVFLAYNSRIDHTRRRPVASVVRLGDEPPSPDVLLEIELQDAPVIPAEATHVEIMLFRRAGPSVPTDRTAVARVFVDLDSESYPPQRFTLPEGELGFHSLYFWTQRYVKQDGSGELVRTFPPLVYGITTENVDDGGDGIDFLLGLPGARDHVELAWLGDRSRNEFEVVGTLVEESPIPDFPDDDVPAYQE